MYTCTHVCRVYASVCIDQKMALDARELELEVVVRPPMWVLCKSNKYC